MSVEWTLSEWVASASDAHSLEARALAQDALLDITGCIVGGSREPATEAILKVAAQFGGGVALAMGSNLRMSAPWAALVTGTAAHALDFDDNFAPATTHATAVLAPALFALADEEVSSGADILDAYIVGLEVQARIGRLVNPSHYEAGWHGTSTVGAIGTAVGCARLLGLDASQTLAAMSIAFSMASGSKKQFGSMVKPIHAGLAAKNAVLAARMAQAGITGDTEPLTGQWGFAALYSDASGENSRSSMLDGLGRSFAIETDGLLAKRFPCCGAAHRTLDGLVALREQYRFELDGVERVEALIPAFARANLRFDDPRDANEGRFSLTYCAARVLQNGRLSLNDMTLQAVRDPSIRPWLERIVSHTKPGSVSEELGLNATPVVTRVVLKNGLVHEIGIKVPKGSRLTPLSDEEKRQKFIDCCQWSGRGEEADRLFTLARSFHDIARFTDFSEVFAPAS